MELLFAALVGAIVGAAVGALVAASVARRRRAAALAALEREHESALAVAAARHEVESAAARSALAAELAAAEAEAEGLRRLLAQHRAEAQAAQERERRESAILERLAPVSASIGDMRQRVEELERQRAAQHAELRAELANTQHAAEQLGRSAAQLREAMKSSSHRGQWGELQLRNVATAAGMLDRVDFDTQHTITVDGRQYRPDMVVRLPGGRQLAVDAKAPFDAYLRAVEIPLAAEESELHRRDGLLREHVRALRAHIDALASKRYWAGLETAPEMVIAFIPSESLLGAALEADPTLLDYAFGKQVALASPVTLFSVLKAIAVSWTHEQMTREAREVFDLSRTLYERLVTLAERVDKLGRSLTASVRDYNAFVGSLERSVVPQARRIAQTSPTKPWQELAELEADVRELTSSDLVAGLGHVGGETTGAASGDPDGTGPGDRVSGAQR